MFVKKPTCDRFAPVVGKILEGFGVPKPDTSSLLGWRGVVRDIEHHYEIERQMDWRSVKYRETARDSVFEQNQIRRLQVGNRTGAAPNLEWNDDNVGLDVKRRLGGLSRSLLCQGHANQEYAYGNRSAGLNEHNGNLRSEFGPS
jgi:hypothetical protein